MPTVEACNACHHHGYEHIESHEEPDLRRTGGCACSNYLEEYTGGCSCVLCHEGDTDEEE
jgi:hypothetical protein